MKIFRAIGLALIILMLQQLMPRVFQSFEDTLVTMLNLAQSTFEYSQAALTTQSAAMLPQI
jgi:hypothetical protein